MTSPTTSPRMRQILESGVRVTAASGLRGLTHRAVDAEAGLPQGSTSAYLRTRLALLEALADHVAAQLSAEVQALAGQVRGEQDDATLVDLTVDLFVGWLDEPETLLARLELDREAVRQPAIRARLRPWRDRLVTTVAEMLERIGLGDPGPHATAVVAALDGVLAHAVSLAPTDRAGYVREVAPIIVSAFVPERSDG